MERIREARRGNAMALNNGISRRRPRSGGSRDSPDEDGTLEMPESTTTRLRDRASKRDRDRERERLSRGKRRRDSMALHGGRDEGDDSSDESVDEDEDDEEDDDMSVPSRSHNPSTSSVSQGTNHHHNHQNHHLNHGNNNQNYNSHHQQQQRKSLLRLPARWRADEMIGVPVPRKARTPCRKRTSNEWFETAQRQASASPSRMSPASTSQQISPSGSNAAIRKKIKSMNGPKQPRPPPPKVSNSKQSFFIQEEIEVAEVLFGLTRQFKQEKQEQKEPAESKSRASSPQQTLPLPLESNLNSSSLPIIAPKRKRPRNLKEDETPASVSSTSKPDKSMLEIKVRLEAPSPKREKNPESPAVRNGFQTQAPALPVELSHERELKVDLSIHEPKQSTGGEQDRLNRLESREESFFPQKEAPAVGSVSNHREEASKKTDLPSDGTREHNFSIDLMAPPPGKLSPERDGFFNSDADQKAQGPEVEMVSKANTEKKEEDEKPTQVDQEHRKSEKTNLAECSSKKLMGKDRGQVDLQLDLEKPKIESLSSSKTESQQPKATKVENRQDKAVPPSTMPMPMAVGGWPGNMPPFGFMSQVPPMPAGFPVSGNPGSSNNLQPRSLLPSPIQRTKRCATHCYIAQLIGYHQRFAKMNTFWPTGAAAAAATSPAIYGARPFTMGMVPPSESALMGSQVPGNFPGRNLGSMPDAKGAPPNLVTKFPGHHSEEKGPPATESAQRKQQVVLQQQPQSGPMGNMMPAPAFIFPINQQQAAAAVAAAAVAAANRGGTMPPGASSSSGTTSANAGPTATVNLSFAGLPPGDQFLTILQNGAYPYPVPGHNGAPPPYRSAAPGQAMPFFSGPFYPTQMPHPSQLQAPPHQQQALSAGPQQQTVHPQQQGQKMGVSSSSSSSQKNQQQPHIQELSGFGDNRSHLLGTQSRPQDGSDKSSDGRFVTQDNRMPPSQKGFYGHNFSLPVHPQNFAYMSSAGSSAALNNGNANHSEKQSVDHPQQPHPQARNHNARIDLASSQPFAMPPFGAFPGPGGAPVGLDFSSMVNNHHIFQNHPDGARHGYPHMGSAPNAAVASQHQKTHNPADSKSASGDSSSRIVAAEEERKNPSVKFSAGETQHPLSFSKKENEHSGQPLSNTNAGDNSSRTLNLIQGYREGHGSGNRSANTTPALTTSSAATIPPSMGTSQQMLLQKQQMLQQQQVQHHVMQQQQQQQQQLANSRPKSAAPSMASFPSTLMTFPQGLMQGGGSSNSPGQSPQWKSSGNSRASTTCPGQSPQWKSSGNSRAGTPATSAVQAPSSATQAGTKNNSHHVHQQSQNIQNMQNMQNMQQSHPFSNHQTQISFGSAHSLKTALTGPNQQGVPADISRSLVAAMAGASPSPSASKNSTSSSPPSISVSKPGPTASSTLTPSEQHSRKNSPSSSSNKAPPSQNHHNAQSILGHPSMAGTNHSSMKSHNQSQQQQQHQHQHQLKQQSFGQPPLFFSTNPYGQQGQSPANAAAAAAATVSFHQKRQSDKMPQQQNPSAGPTVLRMPAPGLLHAAGVAHQRIPASFYLPVAPVSVSKPSSDQKPTSGN